MWIRYVYPIKKKNNKEQQQQNWLQIHWNKIIIFLLPVLPFCFLDGSSQLMLHYSGGSVLHSYIL